MKKELAIGLAVACLAVAGCGDSVPASGGNTQTIQETKTQVTEKLDKVKAEAQKLQKEVVEKIKEANGNTVETVRKIEKQLKDIKEVVKDNVSEKDVAEVKGKLEEALKRLKKK
ncbi:MAG: hypothetical protein MJ048_05720 [Acidaminococcaceae bacterium]|nr:hypothetical protein [Acidaminococcaceae bacterium]